MQVIHNKKKQHHKKVLFNSYRFEEWLERILLLLSTLLMVETRSKLERQHKSGSAELSQNKAVHESTAYQFHSNHGILTLAFTYRINLMNNA